MYGSVAVDEVELCWRLKLGVDVDVTAFSVRWLDCWLKLGIVYLLNQNNSNRLNQNNGS